MEHVVDLLDTPHRFAPVPAAALPGILEPLVEALGPDPTLTWVVLWPTSLLPDPPTTLFTQVRGPLLWGGSPTAQPAQARRRLSAPTTHELLVLISGPTAGLLAAARPLPDEPGWHFAWSCARADLRRGREQAMACGATGLLPAATTAAPLLERVLSGHITALIAAHAHQEELTELARQEQARLSGFRDAIPDMLFQLNQHDIIIDFRAPNNGLLAVEPESFINKHPHEATPELADMILEAIQQVRATNEVQVREYPLRPLDGQEYWFEARVALSPIGHSLVIVRNITEQKQSRETMRLAKEAAEQADRAKTSFVANVSHEIRTPLNAVIGMTSLLLETDLSPEQREYATTVRTSSNTLLALINDVLDFAKIESGSLDLEQLPFSMRECIEDAIDLVLPQAVDKDLTVVLYYEPDQPEHFIGDMLRLRQIAINLLSNAVKFTNSGEIMAAITTDPDSPPLPGTTVQMQLTVMDTGIGLDMQKLKQVFSAFGQADPSMTRRYGGTGLGLTIVHDLVTLMGGTIEVASRPGLGATFTVVVPLTLAAPPPGASSQLFPELQDRHLLVVAAHPGMRLMLSHYAASWGMRTTTAERGHQTLQQLDTTEFDVVLITAGLPDMTGPELARALSSERPALPIVLMYDQRPSTPLPPTVDLLPRTLRRQSVLQALVRTLRPGQPAASREPLPVPDYASLRMLVAEDNEVNQKVILKMLERLGCHADVVADGQAVLAAFTLHSYDVVLMDISMPLLDGVGATQALRRLPLSPQPWIIAVTASALVEDRERFLAAGINDYLSKPVTLAGLDYALTQVGHTSVPPTAALLPSDSSGSVLDQRIIDELTASLGSIAATTMRELMHTYRTTASQALATMRRALDERDQELLHRTAHTLRSSSAVLGAIQFSSICQQLEQVIRKGRWDEVLPRLCELEAAYPQVARAMFDLQQNSG